jgi:hypothetical protein
MITATIIWPAVIAIIGVIAWFWSKNGKVQRMGEIAYFCGLFWIVYLCCGKLLHF